jgi:hypothetical protein
LAGCWSRRKFYELHVAESSKVATETVERMAKLCSSRRPCAGKALTPMARCVSKRPPRSSPSSSPSGRTLPRISGKSKLAEALPYAISRRAIFERFLTDGRIKLDSNIVERAIRPLASVDSLYPSSSSIWKH